MRTLFLALTFILISFLVLAQCTTYQSFESFGTAALPTQGGTWAQTGMVYSTNSFRTGARSMAFNGSGDWIRTPQLATPSIISFWYKRSSNSTAWSLVVETSPNNTTWTTRGTITNATVTQQQYTLNLGSLGLTNIYVKLRDARSSGAHERYVDDLTWTSTNPLENNMVPFPLTGNCTQIINSNYLIIDQGGPNETYNNNMNQTMTLQPSDNTKKVELTFTSLSLETGYDTLFVYDGPNTSSVRIGTYTGTTIPGTLISTAADGELTLRVKTDISNVGTWTGFQATASMITPLPVELLYFEGIAYPLFNSLKWATASEHNSDYFSIERSTDGEDWRHITIKPATGNSTEKINYFYLDNVDQFIIHYYKLVQYDIDGKFEVYGPIMLDNRIKEKKIVNYINTMGQEVNPIHATGLIFEVYEDGSIKRVIR
jgi:hypothetical protein